MQNMKSITHDSDRAMSVHYDQQAADFLARFGFKFRITLSNSKPANWEPSGNHYRVTLSRNAPCKVNLDCPCSTPSRRLAFDFWGSLNDAEKGEDPSAYDVLTCIGPDLYCPETFADFCSEYGYEEDSRKALQTFSRADRFARRLRSFFTEEEQKALAEIR